MWEVRYRYAGAPRSLGDSLGSRAEAYDYAQRVARRAQRGRLDVDIAIKDTETGDVFPYFVGHDATHTSRLDTDSARPVESARTTSEEDTTMPKRGARQPWRLTFQYSTQDKAANVAHYTREEAERAADEMIATAAHRDATVTITISNRDTGESFAYPKEEDTMPATPEFSDVPATPDTDEQISAVHAHVDAIKHADFAQEVREHENSAEAKIKALPTKHRTALRKAVRDARTARLAELEAAAQPSKEVATKDSAEAADDFTAYAGVPELISDGVKLFGEGISLGLKLGNVGEKVAHVMLDMRTRITNPDTNLPDLMADRKTTKNAAAKVYAEARAAIADDDVDAQAAHASLIRATQNKMSDVLVSWLDSFDGPDREESMRVLGDVFPDAVSRVNDDVKPSDAIRALYADKGVILPRYGRTELARYDRRVKAIETATKELEALRDGDANPKDVEALEAKVKDLRADVPEEILAERLAPVAEKTDAERTAEALEAVKTQLGKAAKRFSKVKTATQRRRAKAELYAIIREAADAFELDLSALVTSDDE